MALFRSDMDPGEFQPVADEQPATHAAELSAQLERRLFRTALLADGFRQEVAAAIGLELDPLVVLEMLDTIATQAGEGLRLARDARAHGAADGQGRAAP